MAQHALTGRLTATDTASAMLVLVVSRNGLCVGSSSGGCWAAGGRLRGPARALVPGAAAAAAAPPAAPLALLPLSGGGGLVPATTVATRRTANNERAAAM